jgi:hypothetical protein
MIILAAVSSIGDWRLADPRFVACGSCAPSAAYMLCSALEQSAFDDMLKRADIPALYRICSLLTLLLLRHFFRVWAYSTPSTDEIPSRFK